MDKSILSDIKSLLGAGNIDGFDDDILMHINSVLLVLRQLGVGPSAGVLIDDKTTWSDILEGQDDLLRAVKSYVYLKVRLNFDPPTSGAVMQAMKELIAEYEWRLNVVVDPGESEL
jgi:hypothetical protein